MKTTHAALGAAFGLFCLAGPATAHHSWQAEYDPAKVITLKGVVSKIEWTNPHVRIYVDVKDDKGGVVNWDLELQSVNTLTRAGWDRTGHIQGAANGGTANGGAFGR